MNPAMCWKALRIIPRLSRDEWDGLDLVSRWLIITRTAVFVMTAISACLLGSLLSGRTWSKRF